MPRVVVTITEEQQRALRLKISNTGAGSIDQEIRKAIDQYLSSAKQIESSFLKELKKAKPKDLPPLSTIERKLGKTMCGLDWTKFKLKASERRMEALARLDSSAVGRFVSSP